MPMPGGMGGGLPGMGGGLPGMGGGLPGMGGGLPASLASMTITGDMAPGGAKSDQDSANDEVTQEDVDAAKKAGLPVPKIHKSSTDQGSAESKKSKSNDDGFKPIVDEDDNDDHLAFSADEIKPLRAVEGVQ